MVLFTACPPWEKGGGGKERMVGEGGGRGKERMICFFCWGGGGGGKKRMVVWSCWEFSSICNMVRSVVNKQTDAGALTASCL